jgi:hypothetical protein
VRNGELRGPLMGSSVIGDAAILEVRAHSKNQALLLIYCSFCPQRTFCAFSP